MLKIEWGTIEVVRIFSSALFKRRVICKNKRKKSRWLRSMHDLQFIGADEKKSPCEFIMLVEMNIPYFPFQNYTSSKSCYKESDTHTRRKATQHICSTIRSKPNRPPWREGKQLSHQTFIQFHMEKIKSNDTNSLLWNDQFPIELFPIILSLP